MPVGQRARTQGGIGGFTLLELIAVIAILGLAMALAFPKFEDVSGARMRSTTRELASTFRYVYSLAIFKKSVYRIRIDLDNRLYAVEKLQGAMFVDAAQADGDPMLRSQRLPDTVFVRDMRVLGRDEVEKGEEAIAFFPQGYVERAVLHLSNESGDIVYTLVTKPLSGRVAIFNDDRDIELTVSPSSGVTE